MDGRGNSGARIDPSLVEFMGAGRGNEAIDREEAPVSETPTPIGRVDAPPLVIEGEADVDGFLATPSAAQLPQTRALGVLDDFQTAFHGNSNGLHVSGPAVSLPPEHTATAQFRGLLVPPGNHVASSTDPWWSAWNYEQYLAWQQLNTEAHLISSSPVTVPPVSPPLGFPFHYDTSFSDWPYDLRSYNGYGGPAWNASTTWTPTPTSNQAVHSQLQQAASPHSPARQTYRHAMFPVHAGLQSSTAFSPTMPRATYSTPPTNAAREAAALLSFDPGQQAADSLAAVGGLGTPWSMSILGSPMSQPYFSPGPSRTSYNPSETGSSHSYSTYLSKPSSRSRGPPRHAANSMARTNSTQSTRPLLPKGDSSGRRRAPTSSIVSEDTNVSLRPANSSFSSSSFPRQRGRRNRSLALKVRQSAKKNRDNRSVCFWCKLSRIQCERVEGFNWCQKCESLGKTSSCTVFYFMNLVEDGSTRFTENHSIRRFLLQRGHRRSIDLGQLLRHIERQGGPSVIRAMRGQQLLYDLDLDLCHKYLAEASSKLRPSYPIEDFVHDQTMEKGWETCVRMGDGFAKDALRVLAMFDDEPDRTTYRLIQGNGSERCLDPDNDHHEASLLVAHVLSYTFGRQVEYAAFAHLSGCLHKHEKLSAEELDCLSEQLFTLRWGVSLDARRSVILSRQRPSGPQQEELDRLAERMKRDTELCRKLYMCLCFIRQKRDRKPLWMERPSFGDRRHRYAGTQYAVVERFPKTDSPEAFDEWMVEGREAVGAAQVLERVRVRHWPEEGAPID